MKSKLSISLHLIVSDFLSQIIQFKFSDWKYTKVKTHFNYLFGLIASTKIKNQKLSFSELSPI